MNVDEGWSCYSPVQDADAELQVIPANLEIDAGEFSLGEVLWPADKPKAEQYVYTGEKIV